MPITTKHGSIFDSTAQVLVCPVNCVGVMGKGLALEFKKRYTHQSNNYIGLCRENDLRPGGTFLSSGVIFAATKSHWKNLSRIEWVEESLLGIVADMKYLESITGTKSLAIPQLGCGCGGLDWADVWPLYEKHLGDLPIDVEVWIYE